MSEEERDLRMKVMASRDSGGGRPAAASGAPSAGESLQQQQRQPQQSQQTAAKPAPGTIRAPEARRKLVSIDHAAPNSIFRGAIGSLKRQASSSSVEETEVGAKAALKRVKAPAEDSEGVGNGLGKRTRPDEAATDGAGKQETVKRPREVQQPEPETPIATLDDLFRKTNAKPALYWLPVSEEEVQKRRDAVALLRAQTGQTA